MSDCVIQKTEQNNSDLRVLWGRAGSSLRGSSVTVAPMIGGSVKSEPGFGTAVDAVFEGQGHDWIHTDPDGKRIRLNAHGVVKDSKTSGLIYINYSGIVDLTEGVVKVLSGAADAKTTDFGNSFIEMRFETGHDALRELETSTFVGAGRFRVNDGKVTVEYKISKVVL